MKIPWLLPLLILARLRIAELLVIERVDGLLLLHYYLFYQLISLVDLDILISKHQKVLNKHYLSLELMSMADPLKLISQYPKHPQLALTSLSSVVKGGEASEVIEEEEILEVEEEEEILEEAEEEVEMLILLNKIRLPRLELLFQEVFRDPKRNCDRHFFYYYN